MFGWCLEREIFFYFVKHKQPFIWLNKVFHFFSVSLLYILSIFFFLHNGNLSTRQQKVCRKWFIFWKTFHRKFWQLLISRRIFFSSIEQFSQKVVWNIPGDHSYLQNRILPSVVSFIKRPERKSDSIALQTFVIIMNPLRRVRFCLPTWS